ncbi:ABC transporter permease [Natronobacterium gregoryi]|uniref:ABC transporter n=2 Tax=Natronobacterium gregoryi TaxID=44930 RepID=L0AEF2_NATGS|nr:ABC transporter permease [Natronobacterium gregoryi]AFZ71809.1 ABC-type multidrug transport system, permease component [Natronobacterium gregoryi SP2]ELY72960.1 ABC transporter [Natronobacterium gregoryi SP2]PLK21010.1 ABC transporter permease [Natronobacterium gregoryi SP2]SFI87322.1 ABC-2 type transport system permease protein [Natronobacterium gregoryi]
MSRIGRIRAEADTGWRSFARRRTAVFFTFFFPVILIVIFGALVRTDPAGDGLFAEPAGYYVPGYLAVVVLFTPLSRMGSEVARHREGNRFEKLATTPLSRCEWLLAQTIVNAVIIGLAGLLILVLVLALTGAELVFSTLLVAYVLVGVICFCGIGAMLGSYTDSRDGAVAASNAIALPLLFLSETFVTLEQLPGWFEPLVNLSPLTYFARGVRAATYPDATTPAVAGVDPTIANLGILVALAVVAFALGARSIPRTD